MIGVGNMWKFRKLTEGELERDPHEAEFFNVGDIDPAASLIREIIQNSLDAMQSGTNSIRVRFTFGKHAKSDDDPYYGGLIPHIESCELLPRVYSTNDGVCFLTIEDFETTGLDGPVKREEIKEGRSGNYYNFWLCEGKSLKSGQNAGRWGLGKTAYHVASALRSFWGFTIRQDDQRRLLLGKSLLKTHLYKGVTYDYYGYFAGDDYKPIEGKEVLDDFCRRFAIMRNGEPGLSVVIPMPVKDINYDSIIRSVIIHYFFPIIKGMLVVEVNHDSTQTILNASILRDIARQQDWENSPWTGQPVDSLMEFLEDAITMPSAKIISLQMPEGTPKMTEQLFADKLEEVRKLFSENKLLWLRVPVKIKENGKPEVNSHFDVYIQKDESLSKSDEFYIRAGITISEIKKLGNRRVRALLSAQDGAVCTFLGDSESPAHTDWKERTENFQNKYHRASGTLRFIKSSMQAIVGILDQPPPGLERNFLRDIFFIPESVKEESPIVKPPPPPPPPQNQIFDVSRILGGFRIKLSNEEVNLPTQTFIRIAYDIRRGNPFSNYHPMDFDLTNQTLNINVVGGDVVALGQNHLKVSVREYNFEIQVTGFDNHRDLIVDVREERQ